MAKTQEGKSSSISMMRVLAMIMIIAFHSMLFYTGKWWMFDGPIIPLWKHVSELLNAIDLPMFVFISGFLFCHLYIKKNKYRDISHFIRAKAQRLLIPYLFWGVFMVIAMPSLNQWSELLTGISHLWFLLMLLGIFISVIGMSHFLCQKASPIHWTIIFIVVFLLFFIYHEFSTHHFFLCIHAVLFYLPAFFLGMCCARFRLHEYIPCKYAKVLLATTIFLLVFYYLRDISLPYFVDYFIVLFLGYTFILCSFVLLNKMNYLGNKTMAIINHFDKQSMGIYIFNQIIINIFLLIPEVRKILGEHYYIGVPIIFLTGLIIPWMLSLLFNRFKILRWTIG